MVPNTADNGQEIGAGPNHGRAIRHRDAADGNARDCHQRRPPLQELRIGASRRLLGIGREESAERDVIGALFRRA